ncbi:hypothetical protein QCA50_010607 [Cerrena zonata]|uniref:Uncharacterized protein n=1 Tax=Cerrena zonata TaxID=2478898 RepID=A0AAW0FZ75_9APHY
MHPYWHWHHRPSRLLWFVIGATTATWWIKSREYHRDHYKMRHCSRRQIPAEAYPMPASSSAPLVPDASANPSKVTIPAERTQMLPPMAQSPSTEWGWGWNSSESHPRHVDPWEDSRGRTDELSNRANEKFMEISEATIDSVLSTVESLKARLAEHRAQREQQAKALQAMQEEQARQFEEWKKNQPPRHIV